MRRNRVWPQINWKAALLKIAHLHHHPPPQQYPHHFLYQYTLHWFPVTYLLLLHVQPLTAQKHLHVHLTRNVKWPGNRTMTTTDFALCLQICCLKLIPRRWHM